MNMISPLCVATVVALAGLSQGQESVVSQRLTPSAVANSAWPAYRRDPALTRFSPLVGGLAESPREQWKHDLGGLVASTEQVQLVDINGDGRDELLRVLADRLICQSVQGDQLWETQQFARPEVILIRDFAGDGTRGLLVASSIGTAHHRYMVSGKTGTAALLYTCRNVFGRYERLGKILASVPGEQLCAWWSGDSDKRFGGSAQRGVGYLWIFEDGLDRPRLRFHAEDAIYAPLHL